MSVIDRLITQYELDDRKYQAGAQRVVQGTQATGSAMASASGASSNFAVSLGALGAGGSIVTGFATAAAVIVTSLAAISAGFIQANVNLAQSAVKMSVDFERMAMTIGGALGGLDKGQAVMKSLQGYAVESAFSFNDLSQAATQMVAAGMDIRSLLPVAERFALVIGGTSGEGLQMVTRALILAKGGAFGESMESLRRAGVGRADFEKQGIKMDAGGQIQSTPQEFVDAIIRISEGRPKDMADALKSSDAVKLSNAGDAVEIAMRQLGDGIKSNLMPLIEEFTTALAQLNASGVFTMLGDQVGNFLRDLTTQIGGVKDTMVNIIAGLQTLHAILSGVTLGFIELAMSVGKIAIAIGIANPGTRDFMLTMLATFAAAKSNIVSAMLGSTGVKGAQAGLVGTATTEEKPIGPESSLKQLEKIEKNTRELADQQRFILGGNDIGRLGVTPEEKSRMRRGSRSERAGGIIGFGLEMTIGDLIDQRIYQMKRAGQL